ncbi:MAG TPA: dihydrofolate reductase family protein [Anaerolineales bacterium]
MGKIIVFNLTTLDGHYEGPNREIDWHHVNEEFNNFSIGQLNNADTLIFGRVTYELMANYWPTPAATTNDPIVASKMNSLPKIVVSKTLTKANWLNTRLIKGNFVEEISKLKKQSSKDNFIFGSSDLAISFMQHGLIDEYRIMVNPVILGEGKPIFKGLQKGLN